MLLKSVKHSAALSSACNVLAGCGTG